MTEDTYSKAFDRALFARILRYVWPYRLQVVLALLFLLVVTLAAAATPLFFKWAIDLALVPTEPRPLAERFHLLLWISLGFLAVRAVHFAATYGETYLIQWVGQRVLFDLRSDLFAKLMRLHPGFYDRNPVGRLMTRVTSDVDAINQFITGGLVGVIADLFTLVGLLGFMLFLSPKLTLVVLLVAPVLLAVTTWVRLGMRSAYREMRLRLARVNAALQENLSGVETIQLFVKEREREEKFDRLNRDLFRAWVEIIRWFALFFPVVGFLGDFAVASLVYYGGGEVVRGAVSLGLLVAFVDYTRQLFQPLQDLSDKFNLFQGAMASAERIFGVLDTEEELKDPEDPTPIRSFRGEVEFRDVWLAYTPKGVEPTEKDWVLKGVSFRVRPGEKVALVGATGAGKTSVVSLIARFYDPQRGCVFLDGVDVRRYRQEELRRHVGIVLQEPFLFSGTVLDNLRLFDPSVPPERVEEVSRFLGAHEFILRLPKGYQTVLGERGAGLSTGEKQLLALVRALLASPDILLILDEATASVDSETEKRLQEALYKAMEGRTSLIIAHRLSTIRHVDRILVFRKGRLVEEGSHEELLAKGGYYAALYRLQFQEA
ncbi:MULTISPECIES: ABC transporter ATP-binding protein [Thermus]|uniref:ABC transporter, ATP-binding protein n=2 Tax=Thermus thermophilus TaxID=274 RepID=Q5SIM8_THET8|nr:MULTISPECIES: ABC transporter ATP-binding protein [Thermus]QZY57933.1 ABC transporter ATP-binding protein/permease [Thermus thermophilus]BAA96814.1 ABC transporter B [Thermus thermophilus HB8]BAD71164.1 ABC transporter, ATP-binding protein [Thermus thermophilus HB8]BDA37957.1 ABC transporter ATP-binding protein [Thermus thermophilus]BDE45682.1 ABC transporter ATP-binding protein [Thermus thermophilus]